MQVVRKLRKLYPARRVVETKEDKEDDEQEENALKKAIRQSTKKGSKTNRRTLIG